MMDSKYFRYIMEQKLENTATLAKHLNVSRSQMNRKIQNCKFSLIEIQTLLAVLDVKFDELFKSNGEYQVMEVAKKVAKEENNGNRKNNKIKG